MVKKIPTLIKKNFQIFLNSKTSSIMLILGPIILICLIGFALQNTSLKNVKAGVYNNNSGNFSEVIINRLNAESFNVTIEKNINSCRQSVIDGTNDVCIVISKSYLTGDYFQYHLNLYVDLSEQRTVWNIIGDLQGITEQESSSERQSIAGDVKSNLESVSSKLSDEKSKINDAINEVNFAESLLSSSISQQNNAIGMIENSKTSMNEIQSTLLEIKNSNSVPEQYSSDLQNSLNQVNLVNSNLNQIENQINSQNYKTLQSELNSLHSELYEARDSISQIQDNINQIEGVDINGVSEPVTLSYQSVTDSGSGKIEKQLGMIDYLFPTFLLFFILFGATIFSSINRFVERKSGAYIRNILSKAKGTEFILSEFVLNLVIVSVQVAIIVYLASFFLNLSVFQNLLSLATVLIISISIFVLLGIAIGSALSSQESIIIGAVSISVLFFIFTSIIVPIETLPSSIASIVSLLPLTLLEAKLRTVLIFGANLNFSFKEGLSLVSSFFITIGLTIIFYFKNKHKEI